MSCRIVNVYLKKGSNILLHNRFYKKKIFLPVVHEVGIDFTKTLNKLQYPALACSARGSVPNAALKLLF